MLDKRKTIANPSGSCPLLARILNEVLSYETKLWLMALPHSRDSKMIELLIMMADALSCNGTSDRSRWHLFGAKTCDIVIRDLVDNICDHMHHKGTLSLIFRGGF